MVRICAKLIRQCTTSIVRRSHKCVYMGRSVNISKTNDTKLHRVTHDIQYTFVTRIDGGGFEGK